MQYLVNKNNRTENETRARETNLEHEQAGKEAQRSDHEDKIAELEDREARPEKRAGQGERPLPESFQPQAPNKVTLSMRGPRKVESAERETISPTGCALCQRSNNVVRAAATEARRAAAPDPQTVRIGLRYRRRGLGSAGKAQRSLRRASPPNGASGCARPSRTSSPRSAGPDRAQHACRALCPVHHAHASKIHELWASVS